VVPCISRYLGAAAILAGCCPVDEPVDEPGDVAGADDVIPSDPPICPAAGSFCDATALAEINVVRRSPLLIYSAGGTAVFDADGDGDLDVYVTGVLEAGVFYRNTGAGRFTDATTEVGLADIINAAGIGAADLDGDGDQDLVVPGINERLRLLENDGRGHFAEIGVAAGLYGDKLISTSVTFADYDGDGELDFYIGNLLVPDVDPRTTGVLQSVPSLLYRNLGGLRFAEIASATGADSLTTGALLTDLDGDGRVDLYVANDFGPLSRTDDNLDLRGADGGGFVAAAEPTPSVFAKSVSAADFDGDGLVDLYIGNFGGNLLLRNGGAGRFSDVAAAAGVRLASYRDDSETVAAPIAYDAQAMSEDDRGLAVWQARYTDLATDAHLKTSWAALWLDYDHDGVLDLYVVNGFWGGGFNIEPEGRRQPNALFRGRGDGTFEDVSATTGASDRGDGRSAAAGDLDGDGDLDLVVVNNGFNLGSSGGRIAILRNDAAHGDFIRVHLIGTASNRDGIGARVELAFADRRQVRWVSGGDGHSSSQRDAHFGVPAGATPTELRVVWPSGTIDVLLTPQVGRTIELREGMSQP
jgi:enediyne biosynthesis protein E4